ncbi:MAG: hypothetical protein AAB522_00825 [Patescibacteria group bacterium]
MSNIATIPKKVSGGEELVVVRKRDFDVFQKWQSQINDALFKVYRGRKEYRTGKTRVLSSSKELR